MEMASTSAKPTSRKRHVDIGKLFMLAVRGMKPRERDLKTIKRFISEHHNLDIKAYAAEIRHFISDALKKGLLSRAEGKYKATARRRRRSSGRRRRGKAASSGRKRRRSGRRGRSKSRRGKSGGKRRRSRRRRSRKAAADEE